MRWQRPRDIARAEIDDRARIHRDDVERGREIGSIGGGVLTAGDRRVDARDAVDQPRANAIHRGRDRVGCPADTL